MTWAWAAGAAVLGGVLGAVLKQRLDRRAYRYDDEQDLPRRSHAWVVPGTAVGMGLMAAAHMPDSAALTAVQVLVVPVLTALSAIDLDTQRLPDRIVLPATAVVLVGIAVAAVVDGSMSTLTGALVGAVALGAFYLANVVLGELVGSVAGMGLGDAKLALLLGLLLGAHSWAHLVVATVMAFVAAGCQAAYLVTVRGAGRRTHLAFGPHMALGAVVVLALPGARSLVGA